MEIITDISQFSNKGLARIFFRRLWQAYDSGGVSAGRSLRSDLVDAYLELHQFDGIDNQDLGMREFADEARKRQSLPHNQTIFGDMGNLAIIPSLEIGLLCIEGLRIWYKIHENETDSQGYIANP